MLPVNEADSLRTAETICLPDPRMNRGLEANLEALNQRHAAIAHLTLPDSVPEPVRIHFETSKNVWRTLGSSIASTWSQRSGC